MKLHDYQLRMIDHVLANPRCALWAEMGLGKTIVTLQALEQLYAKFEISQVLVLTPPRAAVVTWPDECIKWGITMPAVSIAGTAGQRFEMMKYKSVLKFMSVHQIVWFMKHFDLAQFDVIVIDEAHYFKNSTSVRYKTFYDATREVDRIIELTGTPAGGGLTDLWAQLQILDDGARLGTPFSWFRDVYFESDYMGYNWTLRPGARDDIHAAVSDLCVSLAAKDYLDMPDLITVPVYVEMDPKARAIYQDLERDFLIELESATITADSAAVLTQKLQQAASGAIYDAEGETHHVHHLPGDALNELIQGAQGPVLVTYSHRFQIDVIKEYFPKAEMISGGNIARWNAGEIPVLIVPWSTLGDNLQAGGHQIICFGLTWSLTNYKQLVSRLWRQGQTKPVIVHQMITRDTVHEVMVQAIEDKESNQAALLERVRMSINDL